MHLYKCSTKAIDIARYPGPVDSKGKQLCPHDKTPLSFRRNLLLKA